MTQLNIAERQGFAADNVIDVETHASEIAKMLNAMIARLKE